MGLETIAAASIITALTGVKSASDTNRRSKSAEQKATKEQNILTGKENANKKQAAQRVLSGKSTGNNNAARSTILTGGANIGAPQAGKTLLGG